MPLPTEKNNSFRSGFVAIVGPTNSGKSTLLNAILGTKISIVSHTPNTTRQRILGVKHRADGQIAFLDTPGISPKRSGGELSKFMARALQDASGDITLLVVDAARMIEHPRQVKERRRELEERHVPLPQVIALNKVDQVRKDLLLPLMAEALQVFTVDGKAPEIVPISARTTENVDVLENVLLKMLPEGEALFPPEMQSDQAEDFLIAEIVREKAFERLRQEIPFSTAVKVELFEEEDTLIRIQAVIYVERDSQKGILIGKGGAMLKEIGQAARLELEVLFKTKVFLGLFVRVERDWAKTSRGLERVGILVNE